MNDFSSFHGLHLDSNIQFLKGVGPIRSNGLKRIGIETIKDLLYYLPRRYLDRTNLQLIKNTKIGDEVVIIGTIQKQGLKRTPKSVFYELTIDDGSGAIKCVWFNGVSWISDKFQNGDLIAVFGKLEFYRNLQITHPEFDILDSDDDPINTGQIVPIYPSNMKLKNMNLDSRGFRKIIKKALTLIDLSNIDFFEDDFLKQNKLISLDSAIKGVHSPSNNENLEQAMHRLKFNEHFFSQLLMAMKKYNNKKQLTKPYIKKGTFTKDIYKKLNFQLTNSQINVLKTIRSDLESVSPMNRLIQGDVGSGKTIVSILAASIVVANDAQVAFMAPTEILAEQHYISYKKHFDSIGIKCCLLIGSIVKKDKKILYEEILSGNYDIVIGTHAIIQDKLNFKCLGLIIVDEQHRFGVEQRKMLIDKGIHPNILSMTATPIPRTLAFAMHGEMDISFIDEMPKNRKPIITKLVSEKNIQQIYNFMKDEMSIGRQCFIIYPLIEESEKLDLKDLESGFKFLTKSIFRNYNLEYIHGKMDKKLKDEKISKFSKNQIQCLVSTTVIEVGIDIPNATIMVIENAERFGLTQLHQLRGRVGRSGLQGYCFLIQRSQSIDTKKRLQIIEQHNDGFLISEEDLKLRGPGEFFGTKQHGYLKTKIVNFLKDQNIIRDTKNIAFQIIKNDPNLSKKNHQNIKQELLKNYSNMLAFLNIN